MSIPKRLRLAFGLTGATLALALSSVPMLAASVERVPITLPDLIVDNTCGYDIEITFPVNREKAMTLFDNDGNAVRMIITGNLVVRFENPATGEAIVTNISGPSMFDLVDGSGQQTGRSGFPVGVSSGRTNVVTGEFVGHTVLYCDALAS